MPGSKKSVGVIDIGSNSIKLLVASKGEDSTLDPILQTTDETRISDGISKDRPRLSRAGIEGACGSVGRLKAEAELSGAQSIAIVATSAVREAINRQQITDRLKETTGLDLKILTGREEAELIGLGIRCDPNLGSLTDFYVFDLGGGSLEAISFRNGVIEQAVSLPLGCVRLTERFIEDPLGSFQPDDRVRIESHTREVITSSSFNFDLPANATAVATGGTAAVARLISEEMDRASIDTALSVSELEDQISTLGALPLSERRKFPGLPPQRADVFPTALATLMAVIELGRFDGCRQSFYNLRYGMAAKLLSS
jgi:exopolyphosphatase/guanosine-5'-triphosphate,3'-diphosphate pyrophosphatase